MADKTIQKKLAALPSVDELLRSEAGAAWLERHPRSLVVASIREAIDEARRDVRNEGSALKSSNITDGIAMRLAKKSRPRLRPVINATGVILHTNLGRAPLPDAVLNHVMEVSRGYSNLEYDIEHGERGKRYSHIVGILREITGAEDAIVVNNNAAAVLLCLSALAAGREVVVSRGELIEIGGAFRVPDVMRAGGAILREAGTTNKTHLRDYEAATGPETALYLKVHPSNYRIIGFTKEAMLADLVKLGRERGVPVMYDLGSGSIIDLAKYGIGGEPTVREVVEAGVDVVTFSGDKLLGGPQGGIIVGRKALVQTIQKHPLTRALRVDKMTLAALEAVLMLYRDHERAIHELPVLSMLTAPDDTLKRRAALIAKKLAKAVGGAADVKILREASQAGGGSLPEHEMPTWAVSISPAEMSAAAAEEKLRAGETAVIVRVKENRVLLDARTIADREIPALIVALKAVLTG